MDELSLTGAQEKELLRLHRFYELEVKRCERGKAYLAGCAMAGAMLETALILMVNAYPNEALASEKCPTKSKKINPLLEWKFIELLRVATVAGWLPYGLDHENDEWDSKKAKAGDYAELARQMRNLAHPAVYLEDLFQKRMTVKYLRLAINSVSAASDALFARIVKSIEEARAKDELAQSQISSKGIQRAAVVEN